MMKNLLFPLLMLTLICGPVSFAEEGGDHKESEAKTTSRRDGEGEGKGKGSSKADKCYVGRAGGSAAAFDRAGDGKPDGNTPATNGSGGPAKQGAAGPLVGGVWAKCDGCHGTTKPISSVAKAVSRIENANDPMPPKSSSIKLDDSEKNAIRALMGG